MQCEECGETLLTHHAAKDRHRWVWCRACGLVVDEHPMGRGISGLMTWLRVYGVKKNDMRDITAIYVNNNLREARLMSIPVVEGYLARQL